MRLARYVFLACSLAYIVLAGAAAAKADSGPAFFPTPPPSVSYMSASGVLTDFAIGMKAGILTIERSGGSATTFLIAASMTIDGVATHCLAPPYGMQTPPPGVCPDWPAKVTLGSTKVKVLYWETTFQGKTWRVSDHFITK